MSFVVFFSSEGRSPMIQQKKCPHCFRSYPDITLNFCLDDGSVLSDSFEMPNFAEKAEIDTVVRSENERKSDDRDLDSWTYQKTVRTQSEHPISTSPQTSSRHYSEWTASDFVREITFQVTGHHTHHAQECLELMRHFLNQFIGNHQIMFRKTTWQNGKAHFYSNLGRFTYDFQRLNNPSATDFLLRVLAFLTDGIGYSERDVLPDALPATVTMGRAQRQLNSGDKSQRGTSAVDQRYDYIRAAVEKYSNLGILVHSGSNHRITKRGHTGSVWIVPRHNGVSITANGKAAQRLYVEMERLAGTHHREDTKGYRYYQANDPQDVETIIEIWARL